jgi:formamidopyrimidine-DNA glycosylase
MPELPEVETIKLGLAKKIIGKCITEIIVLNQKSFLGKPKLVQNKKITSVERRAKNLIIKFSNNFNILIHLKMTGQLIYIKKNKRVAGGHPSHDWHDKLPNKYTRVEYVFDDNSRLYFNDLRKFGWCKVVDNETLEKTLNLFGPEPFSDDFTVQYLKTKATRIPNRTVKQLLMDQTIVAGIGNIYNDETLFLSKIHPKTKAGKLTDKQWELIKKNVLIVLKKSIKYGGTTDSDYVNSDGKNGGMQDHLNVYHRTGKDCKNSCGDKIVRIKIGGRGTYYCPTCQKELE